MYVIFLYKYQQIFALIDSNTWFNDTKNTNLCSLQINVRVTTVDAELEFAIQSVTTGKQLYEQVSNGHMNGPEILLIVY